MWLLNKKLFYFYKNLIPADCSIYTHSDLSPEIASKNRNEWSKFIQDLGGDVTPHFSDKLIIESNTQLPQPSFIGDDLDFHINFSLPLSSFRSLLIFEDSSQLNLDPPQNIMYFDSLHLFIFIVILILSRLIILLSRLTTRYHLPRYHSFDYSNLLT